MNGSVIGNEFMLFVVVLENKFVLERLTAKRRKIVSP